MDPWKIFAELCKTVVTEQNVYLDVLFTSIGVEMCLMPMEEEKEENE